MAPRFRPASPAGCSVLALGFVAGCLSAPASNPSAGPAPTFALEPADPIVVPAAAPSRDETSAPAQESGWAFTGSVYAWLASKRGVIKLDSVGIPLEDPDESSGAFVYLEAQGRNWGVIGDLDLLDTTDRSEIATGTVTVDEESLIGELDATWRSDPSSTLQLLAGLRMLDSDQTIDRPVLPDVTNGVTQVDLVVGAQGSWPLGERFHFRLRGDVGGFGLDSDLTYQMFGVAAWEFVPHWGLTLGWRVLGWEFEDGGLDNDLRLSGALFGLVARF